MKRIFTMFCTLSCFVLTACDFSFNGSNGEVGVKLTELPVPEINENSYDDVSHTISWPSVSNCDGYTVKVDNKEYSTNALSYVVSFDVSKDFTFSIKARGKALYTSDSLWSETFTWHYTINEGEIDNNQLATPILLDYSNNTIVWERIERASGYEIEFNSSFIRTTAFTSYQVSNEEFPDSCLFSFRIRALSNDPNIFTSNWSGLSSKNYVKEGEIVNTDWVNTFVSNGIGQTVNAISDRYIEPASGTESIFNENDLFKLKLTENNISLQKADYLFENSMFETSNKWAAKVDVKVFKGNDGTAQTKPKNYGKGLGYKFEAAASLDIEKTEKTVEMYYSLSQIVSAKRVEIAGYKNTDKLTSILSEQFKQDALLVQSNARTPEWFVNRYGTHLITAGYFGGRIDATYSFISNDSQYSRDIAAQIGVEITNQLSFITSRGTSVKLSMENNYRENSELTKTDFSVECIGGSPKSFASIESFGENYSEWANSISDNKTLIDVPNESLIFIWDLLPKEYESMKSMMDSYYAEQNDNAYSEFLDRFSRHESEICISNAADFINKINDDLNGNYVLMNDIDFEGRTIKSFGKFNGTLRGNVKDGINPILKNFTLSSANLQYLGLFNELSSTGKISNIDIQNCQVNYNSKGNIFYEGKFGGFVGISAGLIDNCSVIDSKFTGYIYKSIGTNESVRLHCGAIAGSNEGGSITNCKSANNSFSGYSDGGVTDGTIECNIGGIAGINVLEGYINKCDSSGISIEIKLRGGKTWTPISVKMNGRAAGIVGYNGPQASVTNCKVELNCSFTFEIQKTQSSGYENHTLQANIIAKNAGNESGNTVY